MSSSVRFAIGMSTYNRTNTRHGSTVDFLKRSLTSVVNQSYKNWDLIIVGDKFEPEEVLLDLLNSFRSDSLEVRLEGSFAPYTENKPRMIYLKNSITERDFITDRKNLWRLSGSSSHNVGLKFIRENGYTYYCHLDDDDYWETNHLRNLADVYEKYPQCVFANTRAFHCGKLQPRWDDEVSPNNIIPRGCTMVHSSISFRCDIITFEYYTTLDEKGPFKENDADLLDRIGNFVRKNTQYCAISIPIVSCYHIKQTF
jgi:glycosyltransferase involved in cell wall biosynthesis